MTSRLQGLDSNVAQQVMAAADALDAGRAEDALRHLKVAADSNPKHPEVLRMQAGILSMRGRHPEALAAMRQALTQRPQDALYHNTMGTLLGNAGNFDAAIASLEQCCELQPTMAVAWFNLGVMLSRCVRNEHAARALRRALNLNPQDAKARGLLADILRTTGQIEEAMDQYRSILAERPWTGMAWWGLADLKTEALSGTDIKLIQQAMRQPAASDDDLIAMGFALASAMDNAGLYAESLAALANANAIARRRYTWNAEAFSKGITEVNTALAPSSVSSAPGSLGEEVIFVVSLPRSGSTLVEQILASHPLVEGAGELPDLPLVLGEESQRRNMPFPQWVPMMQRMDWERLGHRYLARTAHWRQKRGIFIDKLPNNWIYIGAIKAMLPSAHVIGCRRDPVETCFSCYRQHLTNNEYSRTFGDLASFWFDFDRSLRHWADAYPSFVIEHEYEMLLENAESSVRRLLEFCGLPFELACLHFHENTRAVNSPSATQVRRPLSQNTARATRYGKLLDPLREALGLDLWQN